MKLLCELFLCLGLLAPVRLAAQGASQPARATPPSAANGIALFQDTAAEGCLTGGPNTFALVTNFHGLVFSLQGNEAILKPYVGHQVVLTGIPTPGPAAPKAAAAPGTQVLNFKVEFLNDLGPHCTGAGGPPVNLQALAAQRTAAQAGTAAAAAKQAQKAAAVSAQAKPSTVVNMTGELLKFIPAKIEIKVGQTVLWKNSSKEVHTVTANPRQATNPKDVQLPPGAQPFDSGFLNPGQDYQHTFTKPGTYRYVCTLHEVQGMIGEVVVKP